MGEVGGFFIMDIDKAETRQGYFLLWILTKQKPDMTHDKPTSVYRSFR